MNSINISLKRVKNKGFAPCVPLIENLRILKQNVLRMIGNGVSALVITVIHHFSYTLINAKELVKKNT